MVSHLNLIFNLRCGMIGFSSSHLKIIRREGKDFLLREKKKMSFDKFLENKVKSCSWLAEGIENPSEEDIEHELWNDAQLVVSYERFCFEAEPRVNGYWGLKGAD